MSEQGGEMLRRLEQLIVGNAEFVALENSVGVFCPFEAIGMVSQEIRHSHFIAYCLDPQRPHGFGSECLRALVRAGARQLQSLDWEVDITPIDAHLMSLDAAEIRREWRGIDFVSIISEEKLVVAVELKIDSSEHSAQLKRYREMVQNYWPGWRHIFLFLTKRGDEPSEVDGEGWICVPLESFATELESLIDKKLGIPDANNLLKSYIFMLRRHHLTDNKLKEIVQRIWSSHGEALEFLVKHRPDNRRTLISALMARKDDIAKSMSEASGLTVSCTASGGRYLRLWVNEWDEIEDLQKGNGWTGSDKLVLIELEAGDNRSLGLRLVLGRGDDVARRRVSEALRSQQIVSKRNSDQWSRFNSITVNDANDTVSSANEYTDAECVDQALERIREWAKTNLPEFNKIFRQLGTPGLSFLQQPT